MLKNKVAEVLGTTRQENMGNLPNIIVIFVTTGNTEK